jgi:hypothetical protein
MAAHPWDGWRCNGINPIRLESRNTIDVPRSLRPSNITQFPSSSMDDLLLLRSGAPYGRLNSAEPANKKPPGGG